METRANYVAVGAFVLILLAGSFVAMIWLLRVQFRTEYSYFETHFEGPVTGLGKGAPARLNGIEVGRVQEIEFDPDDPKLVVVILQLRAALVIHSDAVASLETQGLTGVSYVEITGGTKESPPLEAKEGRRYPIIASKPSSLQAVVNGAPEVLARVLVIADRISDLLDDQNRRAIADTLVNLRDTTAVFSRRAQDIDQMIAELGVAAHNLSQATDSLRDTLAKVDRDTDKIDAILGSAGDAAKKVNQIAGDLAGVIEAGKPELRTFATTGIDQLTQLLSETRTLVANLSRVSAQLERDPTRLLFGDRREGYSPK
jgi:phospholipid/cholesterol/gamma-HCH transport system substrate-binding protein